MHELLTFQSFVVILFAVPFHLFLYSVSLFLLLRSPLLIPIALFLFSTCLFGSFYLPIVFWSCSTCLTCDDTIMDPKRCHEIHLRRREGNETIPKNLPTHSRGGYKTRTLLQK